MKIHISNIAVTELAVFTVPPTLLFFNLYAVHYILVCHSNQHP